MSRTRTIGSVAALMVSASSLALFATQAGAQETANAPSADSVSSEVVVTGTRIRGVAPVGSSLVQVDREELRKSGLTSTADLLARVPSVLTLGSGTAYTGGAAQQGNDLNALAFNKSANIRGLGPGATLNLVNGHRVPYEGGNMNSFDGDNIPAQLLQRIEVVEDGTSPIYGADAIAGTVNFIMREPSNTAEAYGQYGWADGQSSYQGTAIFGHTWGSGGFIAAYQRTHFDRLQASARPSLYSDDYSPFGGPKWSDFSNPGNVVINGVDYAIPAGQDGTSLTLAQLGPAGVTNRTNSWSQVDASPVSDRDVFAFNLNQNVTDWLQLFGDGFYSKRNFNLAYLSQGPKVSVTIPNSNFYSPCNRTFAAADPALVAACGTGSLTVDYNTLYDSGPSIRDGRAEGWSVAAGFHADLPAKWRATFEATAGDHVEHVHTSYFLGNSLPTLPELAGTTAASAFNVFCDGSQFSCNPSSMTGAIPGITLDTRTSYQDQDYQFSLDGPVFQLPGGPVRVAVGVERYYGSFLNQNNFGTVPSKRHVSSLFAELYVPLVGNDNALPLVRRLELDVAGRIDKYSDVGTTKNPKIGINWYPIDDIMIHGSFGTSFRAPGLADNNPFVQHGYIPFGPYPGSSVTSSLCSACASVPGGLAFYSALGGANGDLKSEASRSYSLGADWKPKSIPGLTASVNYWWVSYKGQVSTAVYNAGPFQAVNQQYYNQYIIYNPTLFPALAANNPTAFFGNFPTVNQSIPACAAVFGQKVTTQALFDTYISCINAAGDGGLFGPPSSPANVAAVESGHRINGGSTRADGLDFSAQYNWTNSMGRWQVGGIAEYTTSWKVAAVAGAPEVDQANHFGYPLAFKARGNVGWSNNLGPGRASANVFVNYTNAYTIDANLLPGGVGASYTHIDSYTTVDLTLGYDTGDTFHIPAARNVQVILSVQNLFDQAPPLVLNAGGVAGNMFDPSNASPLQRVVQLQISKKF